MKTTPGIAPDEAAMPQDPRQPLLDALHRYRERYPREASVSERIATLVTAYQDCFHRSCRPGHITGSAWVLSADQRRCLLLHHKKLNRWLQPGGHADGDPDTVAVARREAIEESGLASLDLIGESAEPTPFDLDVHLIPARHDADGRLLEDAHEHHDIRYLFTANGDESLRVSPESNDVRWVELGRVAELTSEESVLRMLRKATAYRTAEA